MFTPTPFSTVQDKEKFLKHFLRFVKSDYHPNLFHRWFYTRLSLCFGHIAHYNRAGFYATWFGDAECRDRFIRHTLAYGCYGDPAYTYCDVEREIQKALTR